jgi:hypothetical protein
VQDSYTDCCIKEKNEYLISIIIELIEPGLILYHGPSHLLNHGLKQNLTQGQLQKYRLTNQARELIREMK